MTQTALVSRLAINGLELIVALGWPKEERASTQLVRLDFSLEFPNPPDACQTDDLRHSFCYTELVSHLRKELLSRQFKLLEHLGCEIYQLIKKNLPPTVKVLTTVTKHPSSISNLVNGVSFTYGDQ